MMVRKYTPQEAQTIANSEHKFNPCVDANDNYYLSIKAATALSQIEGFEWAAPNQANLIPYNPKEI